MKSIKKLAILLSIIFIAFSCSDEDDIGLFEPFVVAFENLSTNLASFDSQTTVNLVYSEIANETGTITINISETNAVYGEDYTTTPEAINNELVLNISNNEEQTSFVFNKISAVIDEEALIQFEITSVDYTNGTIQGNSTFEFNASAGLGGSLEPSTGGPNQQNQVFVDLSNNKMTIARRDSWELGFYGGDEFRVAINTSVYMFAAALSSTDIDAVTASDTQIVDLQPQMNIGQVGANVYADDVEGDINKTAITEISETNANNPVYLINMGYEVGTGTAEVGSVDISDSARGWKKIRVLKDGNDYILQYADLNDTTHEEVRISKNAAFNFTFFSIANNQVVDVQPEKDKWDLGFTVFTNVIAFGAESGAYGFSDFVITNRNGNVSSYAVDTSISSYEDFSMAEVNTTDFDIKQNVIGSSWRSVFNGGSVKADIFYILKDTEDNIYKIKFLALTNDNGERGYAEFEYELLQ
jgi:Fe-S cluster assembly iron-binding protein IscA